MPAIRDQAMFQIRHLIERIVVSGTTGKSRYSSLSAIWRR
jgi:hypothetical protein